MEETIVLLHGAATGAASWGPVIQGLGGLKVFAPDMLGYGKSPAPSPAYGIAEEVAHLRGLLEARGVGPMHLVTHSIGTLYGLHLRRALGARVTRLTLVDPIVVSVLREGGEEAGYAEMNGQYERFMERMPDAREAARTFINHWNGPEAWERLGDKTRAFITALAPRLRLEMLEAKSDPTLTAALTEAPPPTRILVGEKTLVAARATARQLGRSLRTTPVEVAGAAHMIPLTHAEQVVAAIRSEVPS